jgi:hypothetical protein
MPNKPSKIMPLAVALAALTGTSAIASDPAEAKAPNPDESNSPDTMQISGRTPNRLLSVGEDLLGFTVSTAADGTMVAQHESHVSHASHSSHSSHYSSA